MNSAGASSGNQDNWDIGDSPFEEQREIVELMQCLNIIITHIIISNIITNNHMPEDWAEWKKLIKDYHESLNTSLFGIISRKFRDRFKMIYRNKTATCESQVKYIKMWPLEILPDLDTENFACGFRGDYFRCYDKKKARPFFVVENITLDGSNEKNIPKWLKQHHILPDVDGNNDLIDAPSNEDFKNSGYTKGHLASKGNHKTTEETYKQTFLATNICPECVNLTAKQEYESWCRARLKSYSDIYRMIVPVYGENPRKLNGKWDVPDSFVEILNLRNPKTYESVWFFFEFPNKTGEKKDDPRLFLRSLEHIKRLIPFSIDVPHGCKIVCEYDENEKWKKTFEKTLEKAAQRVDPAEGLCSLLIYPSKEERKNYSARDVTSKGSRGSKVLCSKNEPRKIKRSSECNIQAFMDEREYIQGVRENIANWLPSLLAPDVSDSRDYEYTSEGDIIQDCNENGYQLSAVTRDDFNDPIFNSGYLASEGTHKTSIRTYAAASPTCITKEYEKLYPNDNCESIESNGLSGIGLLHNKTKKKKRKEERKKYISSVQPPLQFPNIKDKPEEERVGFKQYLDFKPTLPEFHECNISDLKLSHNSLDKKLYQDINIENQNISTSVIEKMKNKYYRKEN